MFLFSAVIKNNRCDWSGVLEFCQLVKHFTDLGGGEIFFFLQFHLKGSSDRHSLSTAVFKKANMIFKNFLRFLLLMRK